MNTHSPVFNELTAVVTNLAHAHHLVKKETSTNGRPRKISRIDALTLAVYQHTSTRATKKSVYVDFKTELKCSYKTLVVSMNEAANLGLRFLLFIMRRNRERQHLIKYTDATDIPVCLKKNADKHRTMAGLTALGRSSKGWYYGLKMTLTRDAEGRMLSLRFTNATTNDRTIFRKINEEIYGIIIADAGYVSKELERDMNSDGKRWILI